MRFCCVNTASPFRCLPQLKLLGQAGDFLEEDDIELGMPMPSPVCRSPVAREPSNGNPYGHSVPLPAFSAYFGYFSLYFVSGLFLFPMKAPFRQPAVIPNRCVSPEPAALGY